MTAPAKTPKRPARRLSAALRMLWASPCSALGLVLGVLVLAAGGSARRVGRTFEFALYGGECPPDSPARRWPFAAITLGHVIVGASGTTLARLRAHEHAHVRQYERLGLLMLLAYPASSLIALLQGKRPYVHNHFEIQACREAANEDAENTA